MRTRSADLPAGLALRDFSNGAASVTGKALGLAKFDVQPGAGSCSLVRAEGGSGVGRNRLSG